MSQLKLSKRLFYNPFPSVEGNVFAFNYSQ